MARGPTPAAGLLGRVRRGAAGATVEEPAGAGVLRATYDDDGDLETLAWAATPGGPPVGALLWFDWVNDLVAWKTELGLSGQQWGGGEVSFGTVFDDDSTPVPGRRIELAAWIDECVGKMIGFDPREA